MPNPPVAINLDNLGAKVTSRSISFLDMSMRAWGSEWATPDRGIYAFSNGRKFDSTDRGRNGIYGGEAGTNYVMIADGRYPDTVSNRKMLWEDGGKFEQE